MSEKAVIRRVLQKKLFEPLDVVGKVLRKDLSAYGVKVEPRSSGEVFDVYVTRRYRCHSAMGSVDELTGGDCPNGGT